MSGGIEEKVSAWVWGKDSYRDEVKTGYLRAPESGDRYWLRLSGIEMVAVGKLSAKYARVMVVNPGLRRSHLLKTFSNYKVEAVVNILDATFLALTWDTGTLFLVEPTPEENEFGLISP